MYSVRQTYTFVSERQLSSREHAFIEVPILRTNAALIAGYWYLHLRELKQSKHEKKLARNTRVIQLETEQLLVDLRLFSWRVLIRHLTTQGLHLQK